METGQGYSEGGWGNACLQSAQWSSKGDACWQQESSRGEGLKAGMGLGATQKEEAAGESCHLETSRPWNRMGFYPQDQGKPLKGSSFNLDFISDFKSLTF